ncbi:MAG TPA: S46 family peptidase [Tepidisphaeraceae bacterium]|jgi:hypothetical protein
MKRKLWAVLILALVAGCTDHPISGSPAVAPSHAAGDAITLLPTEGMWAYNKLPDRHLRDVFQFDLSQSWADHVRLASVRIGGGSGAFISPDGLILTNQHVAAGGLQSASGPGHDYVTDGFLAPSLDQEIKLPGLEVSVLESIEDVTARVNAAVDPKLTGEAAVKARNAAFARIEAESQQQTGLRSSVVTLYGGAVYDLYRYKRYTDIRCAFAPEMAIAFLGGDPDNFEYPRYDLDITLLRAYENGKAAHIKNYLRFSSRGVREGDLVFVSGNPGSTDRLLPVSALQAMRDLSLPLRLEGMERAERILIDYSARGPEQRRQAQRQLFGVENGLKALRPRLAALRSGEVMEQKRRQESAMREALAARPDLQSYRDAWGLAAAAEQRRAALMLPHSFIEQGQAFSTALFGYARTLVRLADEDAKPDAQRLPEYTQANRGPLLHRLLAPVPLYPELETARLADSLGFFQEKMGADSPLVKQVLAGKSPEVRAAELINGSRLADVVERKRLLDGGGAAIRSSDDAMIVLTRLIDPDARQVRREYEAQVTEPMTRALTLINRARFALYGTGIYPDATGTLRLAFGRVEGYIQDNARIPAWTTLGGAFKHAEVHHDKPPYRMPWSWSEARDKLNADTPFDFVSTADIIGGNSGSPVVDRTGDLVGVIFDSNRQGVAENLAYSDAQARAVSVDSRAIIEALGKVYSADALLKELQQ